MSDKKRSIYEENGCLIITDEGVEVIENGLNHVFGERNSLVKVSEYCNKINLDILSLLHYENTPESLIENIASLEIFLKLMKKTLKIEDNVIDSSKGEIYGNLYKSLINVYNIANSESDENEEVSSIENSVEKQ